MGSVSFRIELRGGVRTKLTMASRTASLESRLWTSTLMSAARPETNSGDVNTVITNGPRASRNRTIPKECPSAKQGGSRNTSTAANIWTDRADFISRQRADHPAHLHWLEKNPYTEAEKDGGDSRPGREQTQCIACSRRITSGYTPPKAQRHQQTVIHT